MKLVTGLYHVYGAGFHLAFATPPPPSLKVSSPIGTAQYPCMSQPTTPDSDSEMNHQCL